MKKNSTIRAIHDQYRETQSLITHVVDGLTPEQWNARPATPGAPLAFHVWHIAREADILRVLICEAMQEPSEQIWDQERIASRWGFSRDSLGVFESGLGMDDFDAARLTWPGQRELLDYLQRAFSLVNHTIAALDDDLSQTVFRPRVAAVFGGAATVERAMMRAIANGNRHLGIIGWISTSLNVDRYNRDAVVAMDISHQPAHALSAADK